jgi:hypothetical protein
MRRLMRRKVMFILLAALVLMLAMAAPAFAAVEPNENANCIGQESEFYAKEPFPDWAPGYDRSDVAHDYNDARDRLGYNVNARAALTDCNQKPYRGPWEEWVYG